MNRIMKKRTLVRMVKHYMKHIVKAVNTENDAKILKYIKKISKLPITIKILQKTSVGHLVNSFRANEGAIGKLCTCLVLRWKFIVIEEETRKYYKND